mgnify:CR=1 FL=1
MPKCPNCGSTNIHADKKGFSAKKAIIGRLLFGRIGLVGGAIGCNKIRLTCLDCGYEFNPGDNTPTLTERVMENYEPITPTVESIPSRPSQKATKYQNVKIETLLKFRDVISDSKIELLEAMQAEGVTLVVLPGGELETLRKMHEEGSKVKRIVSFKEYKP